MKNLKRLITFCAVLLIPLATWSTVGPVVETVMQGGNANINTFTNSPSFPTGMIVAGSLYNSIGPSSGSGGFHISSGTIDALFTSTITAITVRANTYVITNPTTHILFDDFNRSNRTLNHDISPSGDTWTTSGPAANTATISTGAVIADGTLYASLDYGKAITRISGVFSYKDSGSMPTMALIADQEQIGLNNIVHMVIQPGSWQLQYRVGAGAFTLITTGSWDVRTDGTMYRMAFEISGGTVTIYPPLSKAVVIYSTSVASITPRYGIWEIVGSTTSLYQGKWHAASLGPDEYERNLALGGGVPYSANTAGSYVVLSDNVSVYGATLARYDTTTSNITIHGFSGGVVGQVLYVYNIANDGHTVTLKNNDAAGTQKILTPLGADVVLANRQGRTLMYDFSGFWIVISN